MNHTTSWYDYINQLHHYIRQQDEKVKNLEQRIVQLENNHGSSNQTTIEKLEYHFDQLKIERLDGTLHIGLTPDDLSNVEDMSLNQVTNSNPNVNNTQQEQPFKQRLVGQLDSYLTNEGPALLQQLASEYNYPMDPTYQSRILNDVRNQLPDRVAHYDQQERGNNSNELEFGKYIYEQVQKEITGSLRQFFQKDHLKGE